MFFLFLWIGGKWAEYQNIKIANIFFESSEVQVYPMSQNLTKAILKLAAKLRLS